MYKASVTWSMLAVISILFSIGFLYNKFTKENHQLNDNEDLVLFSEEKKKSEYVRNKVYDANLDGVVTNKEFQRASNYEVSAEEYDFIKGLDERDRKLLNGLTFEVAYKAVYLNNKAKEKLLSMSDKDRITVINNAFRNVNHK